MPGREDVNPSQGFRPPDRYLHWETEEPYWRENFSTRPYANADLDFDFYRGAYRYGFESAHKHAGRSWEDAQRDLEADWDKYEHRGEGAWEHAKHAVRDAWDRVRSGR
jgi:hypothetical protein